MLSVIIATRGQEQPAVATLSSLVAGAASGLIRDVTLVDPVEDGTIARVADIAGCSYLAFHGKRAAALDAGARHSRGPWLMFLHAGAMLDPGWIDEAAQFMKTAALTGRSRAAVFRHARSPYADLTFDEVFGTLVRKVIGPRADQGLLIARDHYESLGGYPLGKRRSELRFLKKLGRSSRIQLRSGIVTAT